MSECVGVLRDVGFVVAYFSPSGGEEYAERGVDGDGFVWVEDDVECVVEDTDESVEDRGAYAAEV